MNKLSQRAEDKAVAADQKQSNALQRVVDCPCRKAAFIVTPLEKGGK